MEMCMRFERCRRALVEIAKPRLLAQFGILLQTAKDQTQAKDAT